MEGDSFGGYKDSSISSSESGDSSSQSTENVSNLRKCSQSSGSSSSSISSKVISRNGDCNHSEGSSVSSSSSSSSSSESYSSYSSSSSSLEDLPTVVHQTSTDNDATELHNDNDLTGETITDGDTIITGDQNERRGRILSKSLEDLNSKEHPSKDLLWTNLEESQRLHPSASEGIDDRILLRLPGKETAILDSAIDSDYEGTAEEEVDGALDRVKTYYDEALAIKTFSIDRILVPLIQQVCIHFKNVDYN